MLRERERRWRHGQTVRLLLAIAFVVPFLALIGWALGVPSLYRWGLRYSFWPLAALGDGTLVTGQALLFSGRRNLGLAFLTLAFFIGLLSLLEYVAGWSIGIDLLLFRSTLLGMGAPSPGRVSVLSALALIAVSAETLIARYGSRMLELGIFALGALVMGFGCLSAGLHFAGFGPETANEPVRLASALPAGVTMICMACAPMVFRGAVDPGGLFGHGQPSADAMRLGLPILLVLPACLLPFEHALSGNGFTTPFTAFMLALIGELVVGLVLIGLGIIRIARGHAALIDSEARLDHALEAHRIGLFDWQISNDQLRWSPGAEERIGVAPGTLRDLKAWIRLVEPEDAKAVMATIADANARKQERYEFRYRMRRADGDIRTIEGSSRCFYDRRGELARITGVNIDVTERVRNEAEIARREAQWLSILRTVPDAMIVFDREGYVRSFSAAAEQLFDHKAKRIIGKPADILLAKGEPGDEIGLLRRYLGRDIAARGQRRILQLCRADGSEFPAEVAIGETMIDGAASFTAFVRDISDRQAAERKLATLAQDYAHSERLNAVGELASGLAHELNQPLAAGANFLGAAELLIEQAEGMEAAREMVAEASAQMLRAGEIIRRLRDFIAKTDADMRVEPLEETLREAVKLAMVGTRQQGIEIIYDLDPKAAYMLADRIQVQQVVVNIVRNAAQALSALPHNRRRITIATRPLDTELLEVSIQDRGRGLPAEILQHLFAPFRSTRNGEGLGIGLSICRRIIEAHGGTLHAENLAEGGAKFSFSLVRVAEEQGTGEPCVTSMS